MSYRLPEIKIRKEQIKKVDEFRAHHVVNIFFFEYLSTGEFQDFAIARRHILVAQFPLLVTDTIDAICKDCRGHPEINFCAPIQELDRVAADKMGLKIGNRYKQRYLLQVFNAKAREYEFKVGQELHEEEYIERFYGKYWKMYVR